MHVVEAQVANAANSPPPAPAPIKPPKTPVKTPAAKQPVTKLPAKTLPPKARMYSVAVSTFHHLSQMAFAFLLPIPALLSSLSCGVEVR